MFKQISIIGFGLIGSSLARRIKKDALAGRLICVDINPSVCEKAMALNIADDATGAYVTDVGSVKNVVLETAQKHLPDHVHLVPAHPIAGTEHSGPEAGFAELFDERWCILTPADTTPITAYSASGFRGFTRIAASDPTMWRDVFLNNKTAVLEILGRFTEDLTAMQKAIRQGDGDYLFNVFSRTRQIRREVMGLGPEGFPAPPEKTNSKV